MSDDWARKYVETFTKEQEEKQTREEEAQTRRRYAKAGAREKFSRIRERIEQDLQTLHEAAPLRPVQLQQQTNVQFTVSYRSSPRSQLTVDLDGTVIKCEYVFSLREGAKDGSFRYEYKTLRICSDADGVLTVYKNGGGAACVDESEISEFILQPLLDHIAE